MADTILVLIKLKQLLLDDRLSSLAKLYRFEQSLQNRKILLKKKLLEEEIASRENSVAALTFGSYVEWNIAENKRVDRAIINAQHDIDIMRELIREAYKEKKVFEIIRENRQKRELAEIQRKENLFMDELGQTLFRRRQAEEQSNAEENPEESE
ncbi:MAG: hypothetical protein MJ250_08010 [Alphaproteobacteria bacterium]|nr:hypothetical protein [Alphaproteobacteria bacterium]